MYEIIYNLKSLQEEQDRVWSIVKEYRRLNLNVMPLKVDGSRNPRIFWTEYHNTMVPLNTLRFKFWRDLSGIGVICGAGSLYLEVLDFDLAHIWQPWLDLIDASELKGVFANAPVVETPKGGKHLYYRVPSGVRGNKHLAMYWCDRENKPKASIETRGQGGFAVLPGSPASTHPWGKPYRLISGSFGTIPELTPEQYDRVWEITRMLTTYVEPAKVERPERDTVDHDGYVPPGTDFNEDPTVQWSDILEPKGWTLTKDNGYVANWQRPGGEKPVSATTGYCGDHLYVFSTSCLPLESEKAYSKFGAFTELWFGGDFAAASKELTDRKYGGYVDYEEQIKSVITRYQR